MASYEINGKHAIVTGAGSGINLTFAQMLLEGGCSVMIADLKLRPEAEVLIAKYDDANEKGAIAAFQKTDLSDWAQISALWDKTIEVFGQIDIVVNGAGIYEPPSSTLWNAPGISPLAQDQVDASPGVYHTFSVNTMGPIRLAQIAIDYWLENRNIQGNLLWVASLGAYVHSLHTPLYFASKAAIVSFVRSLGAIRKRLGIKNAAVCPGAVSTPIFDPEYCSDRVRKGDMTLTPEQCASVMMTVLKEPQYGDGNIVEVMLVGTKDQPSVNVREVPLGALYPTVGPLGQENNLLIEEEKFTQRLQEKGMRH